MTGTPTVPPLLVIGGPTATGKTALAIEVALALGSDGVRAEIISADSRQVFRGLDIGTAKPTFEQRRGVVHHGLDLADPDRAFSVADFADHVAAVLPPIATAGGLAILVGGTGFYLRAIAAGLDTRSLPADPAIRARIEEELLEDGVEAGARRLTALAPTLAAGVDLRNRRRVARALEIAEISGDVPLPPRRPYPGPLEWLVLDAPKDVHDRWIADRARAQFDHGLIEEARALRDRFDPGLPAFSAIGYREAWALLDREIDRGTAIERDEARNVAFAKRQRTWFRSEREATWLDASDPQTAGAVLTVGRRLLAHSAP